LAAHSFWQVFAVFLLRECGGGQARGAEKGRNRDGMNLRTVVA
jgi:hypothetical protein